VSVAYAIDPNQSSRAFVLLKERGSLYIRTHVCVVFVNARTVTPPQESPV